MRRRQLWLSAYGMWKRRQGVSGGVALSGTTLGLATCPQADLRVGYDWEIPYNSMTFTRSSQGSYFTQAPTDGSSSFLSVASSDVLRTDSRDGSGLILLEGSATNNVTYGRAVSNQTYWTHNAPTVTSDQGTGPDGASNADRSNGGTNQNIYRTGLGTGCFSAFGRAYTGTSAWQLGIDGVGYSGNSSISTTWERRSIYGNATYYLPYDSYGRTGSGGISAAASDVLIDFVQHESTRFPTSPIATNGSTVTRSADVLTLAQASVPAALFAGVGQFAQVSPIFADTDLVSGDVFWLLSVGGSSNGIRIRHDGANIRVEALSGGSVVAYSQALSFSSRDSLLGIVRWDGPNGLVSVNGTNGPAGTPWSWTAADIRVGGIYGGSSEAFCRVGDLTS